MINAEVLVGVVFERIGKELTLSQEIEQKIEQTILDKKFLPGEKLPTEKELCEMFGVSRTALREALHMLSSRGLIYVKKGSGIYVEDYDAFNAIRPMQIYLELNFDRNYLKYIVQVRKMLEPKIAGLAAHNRTELDIVALRKNQADLEKCSTTDYKAEGELDRNFHLILANATQNPMVPMIVEPIFQVMPRIKLLVYKIVSKAKEAALDYHALIAKAVIEQDAVKAEQLMKKHLQIAEEHAMMVAEKL